MKSDIPTTALILGLLGTLPFILGTVLTIFPEPITNFTGVPIFVASLFGSGILLMYGTVILAFMSGVLWGFAANANSDQSSKYYVLSVIPAILVFFFATYGFAAPLIGLGQPALSPLTIGFIAILLLDFAFSKAGLTPSWWMKLRSLITLIVVMCLTIGEIAQ